MAVYEAWKQARQDRAERLATLNILERDAAWCLSHALENAQRLQKDIAMIGTQELCATAFRIQRTDCSCITSQSQRTHFRPAVSDG